LTAADQEVGLVAEKPMRQESEWSTSLPSTAPKKLGSWARVMPPVEVWIAPRSIISSS
jgi:hypothetical protein